jgi:hypothetical protein
LAAKISVLVETKESLILGVAAKISVSNPSGEKKEQETGSGGV